jgi:hypothetical protein
MIVRVDEGLKPIADSVWEAGRFVPYRLDQVIQASGHFCQYEAAAAIAAVNSIARTLIAPF